MVLSGFIGIAVSLAISLPLKSEDFSTHSAALGVSAISKPIAYQPPPQFSFGASFNTHGVKTTYRVLGVYPSPYVLNRLQECEATIYQAYLALPFSQRRHLDQLTFRWTKETNRGLGGGSTISLKCNDLSREELTSVFIHEMGHVVDTGLLEGHSSAGVSGYREHHLDVFKDDLSVEFYSISWKDSSTKHKDSRSLDFVTGYALSDPFEDFAESYNFYLLHGAQFKYAARFNTRLAKKYAYLRDKIFHGKEFRNNNIKLHPKKRAYDSTLLKFSLDNFVKSY